MGVSVTNTNAQTQSMGSIPGPLLQVHSNAVCSRSIKLDDLGKTEMKSEILLLSWLIVLLRTHEESQLCFEWAHVDWVHDAAHSAEFESIRMAQVMPGGLKSTIREVGQAIAQQVSPMLSGSASTHLVVSTDSLTTSPNKLQNGPVLHVGMRIMDNTLELTPIWFSDDMLQFSITRYVESLSHIIQKCISNVDVSVEDCLRPTVDDLDQIWRWNGNLPPSCNFCIHEMIHERAQRCPDKTAITSWDGDLTYAQVDQYSTLLASVLQQKMGVASPEIVPICFEKSKWTIVAVLAVMKLGATFVMMDPALPLARLQNMAKQVNASVIISSRLQYDLSTKIIHTDRHIVVDQDAFPSALPTLPELPIVSPANIMYVIFTSGSTGTPKGVKVSHRSYTSSAIARGQAVGYGETSRVLDFASYAFDVSIDSMLLTLGYGGCLCIPSDEDRLNDLNAAFRRMRINYAGLTPSVARILEPDVISSLTMGLGLGGEAVLARDVALWGQYTRIIIGYGPCECTIGCTVNSSAATGRDYISIGPGNGAAIWIVDPNNHNSLVPVGAVGELLVEGPIVGQGYLNDPDKTAAAFTNDPPWLVAGHRNHSGRRGRLYKTGDLGRYDPDGSGGIVFVGRKDTQVKLRGQRIELGEIESQLKDRIPSDTTVIVEVIKPVESGSQPTLVAFIATQSSDNSGQKLQLGDLNDKLRTTLAAVDKDIAKVLPRYMVPTAYIPVNYIPVLISGKTDRKGLREFGALVDLRQLDLNAEITPSRDLTECEQRLRDAWGETLKLDPKDIGTEKNFFALGGDSLSAMRLVSVCRAHGLTLTVASIFGNPKLSEMANLVEICDMEGKSEIPAFSMITTPADAACHEAASACAVDATAIEDIYPSTPTQESLFTFSLKSTTPYIAQRVSCIPSYIQLEGYKRAWEQVVAASPILRTRLAQLQEPGLRQVVLKTGICWRNSTDLEQYLEDDRDERMELGQSLARYAIVSSSDDAKRYMVWTVHHVLYDGWSEPLVLKQISYALGNIELNVRSSASMKDFVKYVRDTNEVAMREYWRLELKGAIGPQFPSVPSRDYVPTPDCLVERKISLQVSSGCPFTVATLIRASWALLASRYTGSDDIVFGETLTGRDISLSGVEHIVGPLIATVPVRIQVPRRTSVESYLRTVQQGLLSRTPYQHMGMQNIRRVSDDAQQACEAPTGLVIQPEPEYAGDELGFQHGDVVREALHFNPYPLMLAFGLRKGGFRVCASFDSKLIEMSQMERLLAQFEVTCMRLINGLSRALDEISCLPDEEVDQVWKWNKIPPLSANNPPAGFRAEASTEPGTIYPRAMVPWVCDPRGPGLLSPIGCVGELWLEGAFAPDVPGESPAWLSSGSLTCSGRNGKIQSTGDMVQLLEDGSLIFVGRKEDIVAVHGHAVDIADLEKHFGRYLPPSVRAAAVIVFADSNSSKQASEPELVVLVEQQGHIEDQIRVISRNYTVACSEPDHGCFETTVSSTISASLALSLKRLDKFIRDSLPSYMTPSTYVIVESMPTAAHQIDRRLLSKFASKITRSVFDELATGLREAWSNISTFRKLTATENILRGAWAEILQINPDELDVDDNFFRRGGDSVLAMKLVSNLRAQGYSLSVADIFRHMRLGDAAKRLRVIRNSVGSVEPYKPFSVLENVDIGKMCSDMVQTWLTISKYSIQDVYPVTDSQRLDIQATIQAPRTSIQYTNLYFQEAIDLERLTHACKKWVKAHDILRTVFVEHDSQLLQVVLNDLGDPVTLLQTANHLQQYVNNLCIKDIEEGLQLGSPFFKVFHVQSMGGQSCLVIRLSHAQYDGMSMPQLLKDLEYLYMGEDTLDITPFSSYVARTSDKKLQMDAINYWRDLLDGSSLSVLTGNPVQRTDRSIFHTKPVSVTGLLGEITTATLLTSAWALVLARRLKAVDVTFGGVTMGRHIDLPNVQNVMGPCYQLTPVRVSFKQGWTARDLLDFVQQQSAESTSYDFLGFERIRKNCTEWSSAEGIFFDSIVHHQDWEDFDTMNFAGGTCQVDIQNPHGDAAYPLKIVSFNQGGHLHVGVVGSERDPVFVDGILQDLKVVVEELGNSLNDLLVL